jgi:hypothetical protein
MRKLLAALCLSGVLTLGGSTMALAQDTNVPVEAQDEGDVLDLIGMLGLFGLLGLRRGARPKENERAPAAT